ncbi:PDZ domain-containing protein [Brevibacillus fluminis]|uniref:PDZ domain-containing protein n=2 Tax=Brevibacillus fluminis TaxID=511487 RepID=A0A3M8DWV0_9BACL|nr:PDZ domain-containing protein [Brevibacillus fluminis]
MYGVSSFLNTEGGERMNGLVSFFLNPGLYLFILFIYLHYRKQMAFERQLFSARIQTPLIQTMRSIGMGIVGGLFVSVVSVGLGLVVRVQDMWLLSVIALILAIVRIRFLCLAYASGVLGLLHIIAGWMPELVHVQGLGAVWQVLLDAKPLPLLALAAILHLAEAFLVRWNGGKDASPLFMEGKRGRIVGAYELHSFWFTPLVLFVDVPTGWSVWHSALFPGWPLFSPDAASWSLLMLPAVTGYSDLTKAMPPKQKAGEIASQLGLYSLILLALAYGSSWLPGLLFLTALFALFGHEGMVFYSRWRENKLPPYYIQSSRGIKVMAVLPNTPAAEMGILPGEIIVKVNGVAVKEKAQLYPALQVNPAFCKLEVLTHGGEIKFLQCAIYAGSHHQLGIIVVPDAATQYFIDVRKSSVLQLIKQKMQKTDIGA